MKRILKWFFGLALVLVLLFVGFLLSLDTLLRLSMEKNIHAQTGMNVAIGKFHLGLLQPVITIQNFKIQNPPDFGSAPLLLIREIHVEYDRQALAQNQLRLNLVRFDLGELNLVKNAAGKTNLFELGLKIPNAQELKSTNRTDVVKQRTGLEFKGVDTLEVSIGTARFLDLADPKNNREQVIGIEKQEIKNVQTPADLAGLALLVALRSGDFFSRLAGVPALK